MIGEGDSCPAGLAGFADLAALLASRGSRGTAGRPSALDREIGSARDLVFVLVDGLGESMLERLGPDSFLAGHRRFSLLSVFPSTTSCAMTTLATGLAPAVHGVPGRYMYLREMRIQANMPSFRDRAGNAPLSGIPADRVWPWPSIIPRMSLRRRAILPAALLGSPFAAYLCGGSPVEGYASVADAVDRALADRREPPGPSYTFLYIWELDSLCHELGPSHEDSIALLRRMDSEMERLASGLRGGALLAISADHGQIDVDEGDRRVLSPAHPLSRRLLTPPFGEPRAAQFAVKPGMAEPFLAEFERDFGDLFRLLRADSAEAAGLFGGEAFSPFARGNLGDYVALARGKNFINYEDPVYRPAAHRGEHGGGLPEERLVPFIVAG